MNNYIARVLKGVFNFLRAIVRFISEQVFHFIISINKMLFAEVDKKSLAEQIAKRLDDEKSIGYYYLLVDHVHHKHLFRALSDLDRMCQKKDIFNRAAYFQGILRSKGIQTKFR